MKLHVKHESRTENIPLLYTEKKGRTAEQIQKLVQSNDECIAADELKTGYPQKRNKDKIQT